MAHLPRRWTDCILPADYRAFLANHDSADARTEELFVPDDLTDYFERYVVTRRVPDGHLPIASDSSGNLICLGVGRKNRGKVYFWHHEEEGYPESLRQIAATFTQFLERLEVPEPPEEGPPAPPTGQNYFLRPPPDPEVVQIALFDEG